MYIYVWVYNVYYIGLCVYLWCLYRYRSILQST